MNYTVKVTSGRAAVRVSARQVGRWGSEIVTDFEHQNLTVRPALRCPQQDAHFPGFIQLALEVEVGRPDGWVE